MGIKAKVLSGVLNGIVLTIKLAAITVIAIKIFISKRFTSSLVLIELQIIIYDTTIAAAFGIGIPLKSPFSLEATFIILNLTSLITPQRA